MAKKGKGKRPAKKTTRVTIIQDECMEDLEHRVATDRKIALRTFNLMKAVRRDPFVGIGKPEPLKYLPSGTWSRRITEEHRLVYLVQNERVDFLQARYHY